MANGNGTVKWVIALAIAAITSVTGWMTMAVQTTKVNMLTAVQEEVKDNRERSVDNLSRLGVIESQLKTLNDGQREIKALIQRHMDQ